MEYIKSPLNYTGNKYRILSKMQPFFPKKIDTMVDLFCGGATVGLNTKCKKIIFIDNDARVIGLLKFLANSNFDSLLTNLEKLINRFHLSYSAKKGYSFYKALITDENVNNGLKAYNSKGYYALRDEYNNLQDKESNYAYQLLYLLLVYAFNNDLRFSRDGRFNLPVGKTDLNANNIKKLREYINRVKEIEAVFICGDFKTSKIKNIIKTADFIYMDPPYLITDAVYNESGKWSSENEYALLDLIDSFLKENKYFVLSNVIEKRGKRNEPLCYWTVKNQDKIKIVDIDYHYRSASYNKKDREANEREVIILPNKGDAK